LEARFDETEAFVPFPTWDLDVIPTKEFLFDALLSFRLSTDDAAAVCNRLHLSSVEKGDILEANRLGRELPGLAKSALPSELVSQMDGSRAGALVATWLAIEYVKVREAIDNYLAEWRKITPNTDGDILRNLGLPPGPAYRQILWNLRAAWIDGSISSPEEEERLLQRLIVEAQGNG
jgi:tRNA nucleotidyltransferase (CCA-adding enzyme)